MSIRIRSLSTTEGFLASAGKITFAPKGLTFIIGPRGSFKSTIVELLRVAFGCDEERRVAELLAPRGWITSALANGAVRVELQVDGESVTVERAAEGPPRSTRKDVSVSAEIYSQNQIERIAENNTRRLDLVDQAHETEKLELRTKRDELATKLEAQGLKLRPLLKQIVEREALASVVAQAKADLDALVNDPDRPAKPATLKKEQDAFVTRKALLDRVRGLLEARDSVLERLRENEELMSEFSKVGADLRTNGAPVAQEVAQLFEDLTAELRRAAAWREGQAPAAGSLARLEKAFDVQDRPYHALLQSATAHQKSLTRENELRGAIERGERAEQDLGPLRKSAATIRGAREKLRAEVKKIDERISDLRAGRIRELERRNECTSIALERGADTAALDEALERLLERRHQRLREIAVGSVSPHELIDLVESGDVDRFVQAGARPSDAKRFLQELADSARLYAELEHVVLEDHVEIAFMDMGAAKPVEKLSPGQKATALLPLLLQGEADVPLVIDQPEDDLDNRFVCQTLVPLLHQLKKRRQIIVVTHNPNLVTLGRPDQIVVMNKGTATSAGKPDIGDFELTREEVVQILEGGAIAFRERDEHYQLPPLSVLLRDPEHASETSEKEELF